MPINISIHCLLWVGVTWSVSISSLPVVLGPTESNRGGGFVIFQINGENLITVQYDREAHMETIMDRDLHEIITIVYDSSGLPTHFLPATGHNSLNISYSPYGDVLTWQYGAMRQQRLYNDQGQLSMRTATNGAQHRYQYRYGNKVGRVNLNLN
jgi:YD repeat-containing protein